jgi:hypothetical protein
MTSAELALLLEAYGEFLAVVEPYMRTLRALGLVPASDVAGIDLQLARWAASW